MINTIANGNSSQVNPHGARQDNLAAFGTQTPVKNFYHSSSLARYFTTIISIGGVLLAGVFSAHKFLNPRRQTLILLALLRLRRASGPEILDFIRSTGVHRELIQRSKIHDGLEALARLDLVSRLIPGSHPISRQRVFYELTTAGRRLCEEFLRDNATLFARFEREV